MSTTTDVAAAPAKPKPGATSPGIRIAGHALATIGGMLELIAGAAAIKRGGFPPELSIMLLFTGGLTLLLVRASYWQRNRAAWAFLSVIAGVMALCTLFGSAKIRGALGVGFGTVLIFPFLYAFAAGMLGTLGLDYRESRTEASDDKQRRTA
ncbi:MAG TPA: hypothetical protein PLF40_23540 [Kofleriaceae bacterium]|nr:hypothetical protein [Kofleriaceae bacterium]